MFDYQSEFVIRRMERERQIKALALSVAAAAERCPGRASPFGGLRASLAARLARLALAVHWEAAAGALPSARAEAIR